MSLEFLDAYEKYVHEDKKEQSSETELFKLDEVETKKETEQAPVPQSHLSDEDIERIAKKLAEMQQVKADTKAEEGGNEDGC